jgi:cell pole-organizing protein PopZ
MSSASAKANEPSMEEILASIRRIIADDQDRPSSAEDTPPVVETKSPPVRPPAPSATEPTRPVAARAEPSPQGSLPPPAAEDVLDLIGVPQPTPKKPVPAPEPPKSSLLLSKKPIQHPGLEPETQEAPPAEPAEPEDLVAEIEFREIALEDESPLVPAAPPPRALAMPSADYEPDEELISQNSSAAVANAFNSLSTTILSQNARTLEDLVKELLRPMLKTWLDHNLPPMVERMIRAEIERVTRGRP